MESDAMMQKLFTVKHVWKKENERIGTGKTIYLGMSESRNCLQKHKTTFC